MVNFKLTGREAKKQRKIEKQIDYVLNQLKDGKKIRKKR